MSAQHSSVSLALVVALSLTLVGVGSGQEKAPESEVKDSGKTDKMAAPQLICMAWQGSLAGDDAIPVRRLLWDVEGRMLGKEAVAKVLGRVGRMRAASNRQGELQPLLLIFEVDPRLSKAAIQPTVITADGERHPWMTARWAPRKGLSISAATPKIKSLPEWPRKIRLEVKYPIEDPTVIRTVKEFGDMPIEVDKGVRWTFDPTKALVFEMGLSRRVDGKTAGVLAVDRKKAAPHAAYSYRIHLRDGKTVNDAYTTAQTIDRITYIIDVSDPIDDLDQIEKVEFIRQRHEVLKIDDVIVRNDFLPDLQR